MVGVREGVILQSHGVRCGLGGRKVSLKEGTIYTLTLKFLSLEQVIRSEVFACGNGDRICGAILGTKVVSPLRQPST